MPIITKPFSIRKMRDAGELSSAMRALNLDIPVSEDLSVLSSPVMVGKKRLPNAVAINPMEGADANKSGAPTETTFRKYANLAAGGAGIIWFEACGFMKDGRGANSELYINKESLDDFKRLTEHVDKICMKKNGYAPYKILQLSHAGRSCHDELGEAKPLTICSNPYLDAYYPGVKVVSDAYIEQVEDMLVEGACLAYEAGFDAIDLKMCHDFLLREFLSAFTRPGKFGGPFENRTRFYFDCIEKIRARLGNKLDIAVRINAYDSMPYPYGWGMVQEAGVMREDLSEPIKLIRMLVEKGVNLFSISTMFPRFAPKGAGYMANFDPSAKLMPYEGAATLLDATRRIKRLVPEATLVSAGLSWFEQFAAQVGAGGKKEGWFDIAGYGRQALSDPEFIANILANRNPAAENACKTCDSCFKCLGLGWPAGCAVHDPLYKILLRIAISENKAG